MTFGWIVGALLLIPTVALAQPATPPSLIPRKVVRDCQLSLWGCSGPAGGEASGTYEQVVAKARSQLLFGQLDPGKNVDGTIADLREAARQKPERREAWTQLAVLYAETANCSDGQPLFDRMLSLQDASDGETAATNELSWKDRQAISLGLALCQSKRGEHAQAISIYQRLLLTDGPSQRVLYRIGDALLAQGLTDEAARVYKQACLDVATLQPVLNVARSCAGLIVALDRSHQRAPTRVWSQLRRYDTLARYLKMNDFLSEAEPDYYRAVTVPVGCERESRLVRYLKLADSTVPKAYRQRAEEHLAKTRAQHPGCDQQSPLSTKGGALGVAAPPRPQTGDLWQ